MLHQSTFTLPHDNAGTVALYQWQETVSERPVLHWAHANGFNGRTYEPLLTPLAAQFDIYAWDARGHGNTDLCAQSENMTGWDIYGHDLIAVLEHLVYKHGRKIWLGGHSMGGFTSIFAAAERPDLVAGLILADPVIVPRLGPIAFMIARLSGRHGGLELAKMAAKRRAIWPDKTLAKKSYNGRGAFATWQDGFLDAYLDGGLLPCDEGFQLACHPHWEAANFKGPQINCNQYIRRLTMPFTLLTAQHGSTTRGRAAFHKLRQEKKIAVIDGSTHFLPMEMPGLVRDEIVARIGEG